MRPAVQSTGEVGVFVCILVVAFAGLLPGVASAQDIAAAAQARGVQVPQGYYDRIAADPTAFTLPNGLFRTTSDGVRLADAVTGTHKLLVVPALFADSPEPHITVDMVRQALFDGPAPDGTVTEAYSEFSRGALTLEGVVTPWVRTSVEMAPAVGSQNGLGMDADLGPYFMEALALADDIVDYGQFDNDGPDGQPNSGDDDGYVDAMTFEFLEIAGSCGGSSIWPHRWGISGWTNGQPWVSQDASARGGNIRVDGYIVQSVADCSGQEVQTANTIAHEYGHVLGLPDYYHPTASGGAAGRRWVLGCWALMAAGSWGCGPVDTRDAPFGPAHLSAHSKQALGWLQYVAVGSLRNEDVYLEPVQQSGQALRIPLNGTQTLIVEYRTQTGFDAVIPAEGVIIYQEDRDGLRRPEPGSGIPYFLQLLEQDASNGLQRNSYEGGDRGVAGDAWGVGGQVRSFHYGTTPSLRLNSGLPTSVVIHEISVEDGRARLRLSTAPSPVLVLPEDEIQVTQMTPFEERMRIAGGFMPYQASGSVPEGVSMTVDGDELMVSGTVMGEGPFALVMGVMDSRGADSPRVVVRLDADAWTVTTETLLQYFLGGPGTALTDTEQTYLDALGNANGRYDVGDLRKWLREGGAQ
jgi:M6 family metalloprotease-like protein